MGQSSGPKQPDYTLPPARLDAQLRPGHHAAESHCIFAGEGGTIFYRDNIDSSSASPSTRLAFYGLSNYTASSAAARGNVFINTPITSDASGDIFFGYQVTHTVTLGGVTLNAGGGIARITPAGVATYVQASTAAGDSNIQKVVMNAAPAISNDGKTVYVAVTTATGTGSGSGYLLALDNTNASTMATTGKAPLMDVNTPTNTARLAEQGSASPMVAPNGDVYFGVLENTNQFHSRGWMLHFNSNLTQALIPSRFGWDNTASIIASNLVPSYTGSSPYLILTKYNNYAFGTGTGQNRIGIFDPFVSETDQDFYNTAKGNPTDLQVAKLSVMSVLGPTTPDSVPGLIPMPSRNGASIPQQLIPLLTESWSTVKMANPMSGIWQPIPLLMQSP